MKHYLFFKNVEFYPETHKLKMTSVNREISLFSTASRCLELLITHQGSVITQRDLMAFAWTDHGLSVSPNTFYQNISALRKSLAEFIPDENIIITIKRSGLTIPENIEIALISETTLPLLPEVASPSDEKKTYYEVTINKHNYDDFHASDHHNTSTLSKKPVWLPFWFFIMTLSVVFLIEGHFVPAPQAKDLEDPFRNYSFYKRINTACSLFVSSDAGHTDSDNNLINIPQPYRKGYDRVYVTQHEGAMTRSTIYCMVSYNITASCVSESIVREK